jgi:uncharacterized membrane protein
MTNGLYEAKRPMTILAGRYGHPLHPMLVTVPIGAWIASLVFDVASRTVTRSDFLAQGSEWLIGIGMIGALTAAAAGMLDYYVIPVKTRAYRIVVSHMSLNLVVIAAFSFDFFWRYSQYHHPGPVPPGQLGLSAVSLAFLAVSGYLGGKLAYRYGVRVADEQTQAEGYASRAGRHLQAPPPAGRATNTGPTAARPPHSRQAPPDWTAYSLPAVIPPLGPLAVSSADFGHAPELIDRDRDRAGDRISGTAADVLAT